MLELYILFLETISSFSAQPTAKVRRLLLPDIVNHPLLSNQAFIHNSFQAVRLSALSTLAAVSLSMLNYKNNLSENLAC